MKMTIRTIKSDIKISGHYPFKLVDDLPSASRMTTRQSRKSTKSNENDDKHPKFHETVPLSYDLPSASKMKMTLRTIKKGHQNLRTLSH
jgi:hypothetical protein